jgi:hypothetical protein
MHHFTEPLAYASSFCFSFATLLGSLAADTSAGWLPVVVQAGMAGIVVLLLMKHIPQMMERNERMQERHLQVLQEERKAFEHTITTIVQSNASKDQAWQHIIQSRGFCPVRDGDLTEKKTD